MSVNSVKLSNQDSRSYGQVIANFELTAPYSACGPLQFFDIFKHTIQFTGYADIFRSARVCKLWNAFSKDPYIWQQFFINEKIPFVESVEGKMRDYKQDFRILHPITISGRMSEQLFGEIDEPIPCISDACFRRCFKFDPFEPAKLMAKTFKFVVCPSTFVRTSNAEFPFVLNEEGDLIKCLDPSAAAGQKLKVPNGIRNLKILCEHPLAGKENMPVFDYFSPDVLNQCNTCSDKVSIYFMRKCIADDTRKKSYPAQKLFVEDRGFEVASLGVRAFFDAVSIFTSGTCPDAQVPLWSYARTSDTVLVGANVYQAGIGGFVPGSGAKVNGDHFDFVIVGVVPGVLAGVPRPLALEALVLDKGH